MKTIVVKVWLDLSGEPIVHQDAISYQKGMIYSENTLRDMERQVKIIRQVITGGI